MGFVRTASGAMLNREIFYSLKEARVVIEQ
jgi:hypothetical protein